MEIDNRWTKNRNKTFFFICIFHINPLKHIGLNLCNDLRLTHQLKRDMEYAKQEL
jgi:hypothetical protein